MSEDFSGGSEIISFAAWKERKCVKASGTNRSYPDRVEELKGKILEAAGLSFVSKPEPLPEFVDFSLYSSYDKGADLLYISIGSPRDAYATETDDDDPIWYRVADEDDAPVGVTIFELRRYWATRITELVDKVGAFLGVLPEQVEIRVQAALRM